MRDSDKVLAGEIDANITKSVFEHAQRNSNLIDEMVNSLVTQYCGELDTYMHQIDAVLTSQDYVTNQQLDDFTLNLPSLLYFVSEAQEALGIREDVSNAIRADLYNRVREKAQGTVADKDTAGELATQAEMLVVIAYRRAYKKVKLRVEAAYEMLNSVKKVMSRRISEYELTGGDNGGVRR